MVQPQAPFCFLVHLFGSIPLLEAPTIAFLVFFVEPVTR